MERNRNILYRIRYNRKPNFSRRHEAKNLSNRDGHFVFCVHSYRICMAALQISLTPYTANHLLAEQGDFLFCLLAEVVGCVGKTSRASSQIRVLEHWKDLCGAWSLVSGLAGSGGEKWATTSPVVS